MLSSLSVALLALLPQASALQWSSDQVHWNLNQNREVGYNPAQYWGEWDNHTYNPSPTNWRFPFYILTQDRFVDGDPTNNEANGTKFEHDWMSNQFRFGGDTKGVRSSLDYLQGMGIKGLYFTGSPFLNMPWAGHGYDPLDFTLLDHHWGYIQDWRDMIDDIHNRGMYLIMDNTVSTMGDLLTFDGWVNTSQLTPFTWSEYDYVWKLPERRYLDFHPSNEVNYTCEYPRMWGEDGLPLAQEFIDQEQAHHCRASEFDSYGAILGVGAYPVYQNQLSKFASVQDRLREWQAPVLEKIKVMSCIQIAMLDIDGFRIDKGVQITIDALAEFSSYQRECARRFGKENFLVVGEIVSDPRQAGVYVGRGKQSDTYFTNLTDAVHATANTTTTEYIREFGNSALDGSAFQYDVYGALTRFLGLDGPFGTRGTDWVGQWEALLKANDMVSAVTGQFDPRQFFGTSNQDVFRWPALAYGTRRQLLGFFISFLEFPGVPMILFGDEQEFYVLENLADDYVFGRMPLVSQRAWQLHGCYGLGEVPYVDLPFNSSGDGCNDLGLSLDHRDPSHPLRNVLKRTWEMRRQYPVLNDGFNLTRLSERHYDIFLRGSAGVPTTIGIWSDYRARQEEMQDLTSPETQGNQPVWNIYHNENHTVEYEFNCSSSSRNDVMLAPFPAGTVVKNLYYPYEELTLEASVFDLGIEGQPGPNGCLSNLTLDMWGYKAMVPKSAWMTPDPTITRVIPGHDSRIEALGEGAEDVDIEIQFSDAMNCDDITNNFLLSSRTEENTQPRIKNGTVKCSAVVGDVPRNIGEIASAFRWQATLENVAHGVHTYTVRNATSLDGLRKTGANDRFMFRLGAATNPIVFPWFANYTYGIYNQDASGKYFANATAPGADLYRYSTNFGSSWSNWLPYTGEQISIEQQTWSGTKEQEWQGQHLMLNFWSEITGSSDHMQHSDLHRAASLPPRRWPHAWIQGPFNQYGYDGGLPGAMSLEESGLWMYELETEFPTRALVNVWGMNPDGLPDKTMAYGDVDGDGVLDWLPPDSLASNLFNISSRPPSPHIGWRIEMNDGNYNYKLTPVGNQWHQLALAILLAIVPVITGLLGVYFFRLAFYQVKFNEIGVSEKRKILPWIFGVSKKNDKTLPKHEALRDAVSAMFYGRNNSVSNAAAAANKSNISGTATPGQTLINAGQATSRRSILIATMEYKVPDWDIQVKIGGLGVMANLMGDRLKHQDVVWVVPCVGGVDYPVDEVSEPMDVTVLGQPWEVKVQYHRYGNVTYVLLDAPVFRKQTKAEPYPARMDDLDSAVYYSAWNQCVAQAIDRFNVDLYHINDYHGAIAPLYLLPKTIPCCFSVHNAEFQGLWPLRTPQEKAEICSVYNLPQTVVERYVQFGEVFNLLHAGASYLRVHQKGFGAVGVSNKYGKRSWARYPIFWGLNKVGGLPNPDPTDIEELNKSVTEQSAIAIDEQFEMDRLDDRKQAQEWAGLTIDPTAQLFSFVGRWSHQKGIDLIADCFYSVLEEHPEVQLLVIGPPIDLYGKFAALKFEHMMKKFPGRVCSKPRFTQIPPYVYRGAEFTLIPSRDEPFGLVAVEFGRKGALGVGARVGGLGQMPGWWFTIESIATKHLIHQFKQAIRSALASTTEVRAMMRARSAKQRFPVLQWVEDLEKLQNGAIKNFDSVQKRRKSETPKSYGAFTPAGMTPYASRPPSIPSTAAPSVWGTAPNSVPASRAHTRPPSPERGADHGAADESENHSRAFGPGRSKTGSLITFKDSFRRSSSGNNLAGMVHEGGRFQRTASGTKLSALPHDHGSSTADSSPVVSRQNSVSGLTLSIPRKNSLTESASSTPLTPAIRRHTTRIQPTISESNEETTGAQGSSSSTHSNHSISDKHSQEGNDSIEGHSSQEGGVSSSQGKSSHEDHAAHGEDLHESIATALPHLSTSAQNDRTSTVKRMQSLFRHSPHAVKSPGVSGAVTPSGVMTPAPQEYSVREMHSSQTPHVLSRRPSSVLDLQTIRGGEGEKKGYDLQKVDPFFTDPNGFYHRQFDSKLEKVGPKSSEGELSIETYLKKSEKEWFGRFHNAKLGKATNVNVRPMTWSRASSFFSGKGFDDSSSDSSTIETSTDHDDDKEQFQLESDYQAPRGLKKWMQLKIGDWPVYSIVLALGQILAVNSYQVTLLTGEVGETANKLYVIASIYLGATICWWILFRMVKQVYCLVLPWFFYGMAFFLLGMGPYVGSSAGRGWLNNVCTALYAVASSSGSLFFALNFGTEGGAPVNAWVYRACLIAGTQQIYIAGLWYWGAELAATSVGGVSTSSSLISTSTLTAICTPIAVFLWVLGICLFVGLPRYYHGAPGKVPSFYTSFWRRKIVLWLFVTVIIQNYWLSAPYGRNWRYLWSSTYAPGWAVALLMLLFFIVVWALIMFAFNHFSKQHSWVLPIFAIGLGAPRFAQMLWGVSGAGEYVPWGSQETGALLSRSLWLWLGVLDSVQGVGFGMILLQTLTRFYVVFALMAAQVIGSLFTIAARASAPDATGPGGVFPNLALNLMSGVSQPYFWVALFFQLAICVGFFMFFRKEQLFKP